jgi:RHS repeat-associated protein
VITTSVAIAGGSTLATYQYAGSRVPSLALPNNVTRTKTYDALLRNTLVEYKKNTTSQKKFEYLYNLADYRLLEKRHHAGGTGDNYDLDSIYRSVNVKAGVADPVAEYQNPGSQAVASTTGVTYDAAQSRSQVIVTAGGTPTTTNYTTDALNFYTAVGGTTHVRDANGNLKDDGTNLYDYDYRNQLVRIRRRSDLAVIGTYDYDGVGRRVAKSTSAGTTSFYWIARELAMEYDASGLVSRRQRGAGFSEVVSAYQRDIADLDQDGSTTDYVPLTPLYDGAYDCIGVLDHTGAVAESYVHTYDGAAAITNGAGTPIATSAVGWHQGYGQMYRDAESGLLYSVHRHYNPATGRFVTEDPLGRWLDPSGLGNGYSWAGSTYRNGWDPLGLKSPTDRERAMAGIVEVMQKAKKEAGGTTDFTNNVTDDDIDWQGGGLTKNLGDTIETDDGFRVRINIIAIFRRFPTTWDDEIQAHMGFADVIAHEMEHVERFKCGKPHHKTDDEAREYNKRGKEEGDRLRRGSETLRLFEEWLEYQRQHPGGNSAEKNVATAAEKALSPKKEGPPKPKK